MNVTLGGDNNEIIWREGAAPENFKVRKGLTVTGTIGVPLVHLAKETLTQLADDRETLSPGENNVINESYLTVDRDKMEIVFVEFAGKEYESRYIGRLVLGPDFEKFGINQNKSYTPLELAELIKMNRSFFESKTEAMKLVSELRNFEAKVNREVEAKADDRANRKVLLAQTVSTNVPDGFKLKLPIFKGADPKVFEVEIGIDPMDLSCRLISPEANDIVNDTKNDIIDDQKTKIQELHEGLRVFEL